MMMMMMMIMAWQVFEGWDEEQSDATWTIKLSLRKGDSLQHDDLRVGVTATSLNVHLAGQEDRPLLGGELYGRIVPTGCSWKVVPGKAVGSMQVEDLVLTLSKESKGHMWRGLIRAAYT